MNNLSPLSIVIIIAIVSGAAVDAIKSFNKGDHYQITVETMGKCLERNLYKLTPNANPESSYKFCWEQASK